VSPAHDRPAGAGHGGQAPGHGHGHVGHGGGHGPGAAAGDEPFTASLERMNRFQEPLAPDVISACALPPGSRGLDVGCGVGLWTRWLAEAVGAGGHVLGLEPDPARVAAARELAGAPRAGAVGFEVGDATALALPERSVDWAWLGDVLHHVVDTEGALRELRRVVRPGGRIAIKESQVPAAMFLPGQPELERRIQVAEIQRTLDEGAGRSFQERRQTTPAALLAVGLEDVAIRTWVLQRRAPLGPADRDYIQRTVFSRNWGERLRPLLSAEDWALRTAVCEADSPDNALRRPDYWCLYPITLFLARVP
jgi:demethylmenaquinone methyltransferase/2-methoxy-6-polyprenyl-1,4-benzoquinol methylase